MTKKEKELKCHLCKVSLEKPKKYFHLTYATCGDVNNLPTPLCGRCIGVIQAIIKDWWAHCPANKKALNYNEWEEPKKGNFEEIEA